MTIKVTEEQDGTFTISWDENDPQESIFNDWTEEDFIKVITDAAEKILSQQEYCDDKKKDNSTETGGESPKTDFTDATEKDWDDFWEEDNCIQAEGEEFC